MCINDNHTYKYSNTALLVKQCKHYHIYTFPCNITKNENLNPSSILKFKPTHCKHETLIHFKRAAIKKNAIPCPV